MQTVEAGQPVRVQLWWQTLASVEPAEGHIAVRIGDWSVFDERVAIPGPADARNFARVAERTFASGTSIYFHVDNHGFNSWTLNSVAAE